MIIKTKLTLFLVVIAVLTANGINWYNKGDNLYIWAKSGLNLRVEKKISSDIIEIVPYGSEVITLESKGYFGSKPDLSINLFSRNTKEKNDEFTLDGKWVKVKYGQREGYVFDAYLSKLPAFKRFYQKDLNNNEVFQHESFGGYIARIDSNIVVENRKIWEWDQFVLNKWVSAGGIIYSEAVAEERSVNEIIFSDFSKEEAFILLNVWMNIEEKVEQIGTIDACITSESKNSLSLNLGDGLNIFITSSGHSAIIIISYSG